MNQIKLSDDLRKKGSIIIRFRNINIIILVLILILVAAVVIFMITGITDDSSKNYARFHSIEIEEKLSAYVDKDLALVKKISQSKVIREWFADEYNQDKSAAAYDEIMEYADVMQSMYLYSGIHNSLNEYSITKDTEPEKFIPSDTINPSASYSDWYVNCINSENEYTLNIDIDGDTNIRRLWINCKVVENGEVIGVFCSGTQLSNVIGELLETYDSRSIRGFVTDKNGTIQMDSMFLGENGTAEDKNERNIREISTDPVLVAAVDSYLGDAGDYFDENAEPEVFKLKSGEYGYASVAPIYGTDWMAVIFFNSDSLLNGMRFLPLIIGMLAAFIIYAAVSVALTQYMILMPLNRLTDSVSAAGGNSGGSIYGAERSDEFGGLARTIQKMHDSLSLSNAEQVRAAGELERQGQLLHAVNRVAELLLSEDESEFDAPFREGVKLMAQCMDVDRIHIWKNETDGENLRFVQLLGWHRENVPESDLSESGMEFDYSLNVPEWKDKFMRGECVNGPLFSLSKTEREYLGAYGIKSILAIPVYVKERFWGFVSFYDCRRERFFSGDEIAILRSANLMMTSAMERNEAAAIVREADERAKLMLDATPLCCNLWDKDFNNLDCNEEAVKLFKLKDKQEYLDRFYEISPEYQPDGMLSSEKARKYISDAFRDGRVTFEWMHQMLDGSPVPSEITLVRVNYGDEYIVTGYTRDLREYKKMMEEIEHKDVLLHTANEIAAKLLQSESEEFESDLRQCMGMLAESARVDRVYIWENYLKNGELYCTQIYEWSEGAEPQQGEDITTDIPYGVTGGWAETLSSGKCVNKIVRELSEAEQQQLSPQGILSILVVPVFLHDRFWGFVGFDDCHRERTFTDSEESILRSGSLLIAHAMLRNEMMRNIRAAVDEARAASRAKGNFLSNMSHEMRTPMNAIIGMTAIGKSAPDVEKKDYAFRKIEDASNHLLGVINDILDMSKIEADKFELSELEFDFEKMMQNVVNVINFRIDEKQQHFTVYLDRNIPQTFIGDDQRLSQVIANLLANAVKFTPEQGSIRLDTEFIGEENGTCTIQIKVEDTGIGISKEQQSRLFTSFEQAESSTTRKFGGTGLGLAISKRIIELMGGSIRVESELNKGSKFIFTVQLKRGTSKFKSLLSPGINWKNIRVLTVDDEAEMREYFLNISERFNISCDTAESGDSAINLIEKGGGYNIYFVDWKMPGMDGIELSRKIKERDTGKSIIIMISATEWNTIEKEAKAAGVNKFLPKPLFPSDIADCINQCIGTEAIPVPESEEGQLEITESFEGYRILLAEDVEINREIVIAMLESSKIEIECAENGIEVVRMFSEAPERYGMIFMDVQMPEMDGLDATRKIRGLDIPNAASIPIVAMTANVFKEDIEKCLEAGMDAHVGKPLDFKEVVEQMRYYLKVRNKFDR